MKNLFLALAFLFIGSVGFANDFMVSSEKEVRYGQNESFELEAVKIKEFNSSISFETLRFIAPFLCVAYETRTVTLGGATYTETFTYIGWAVSVADCNIQIAIAKAQMIQGL